MQDEVREKSVALVIHVGKDGGKLTAELLRQAVRAYQRHRHEPQHGKQSVKSLIGQGAGVQNIEVTEKNIKSFERVARKYGVDFALKKDPARGRYLVFFKARDADALNAAFAEYTAKTLKRKPEKPSVKKQLSVSRRMAREMDAGQEKQMELYRKLDYPKYLRKSLESCRFQSGYSG